MAEHDDEQELDPAKFLEAVGSVPGDMLMHEGWVFVMAYLDSNGDEQYVVKLSTETRYSTLLGLTNLANAEIVAELRKFQEDE